jgi:uncharacterized protein (TIGR02271 family)
MANTTDRTVVAVFDSASEARAAVADLKEAGFDSDSIYVSSASAESSTLRDDNAASPSRHEHGIKEWFKSLFGTEEHAHRRGYESAIEGGKTVVSVDASESNFNRASQVLESRSPVNIHTDDYGTVGGIETRNTEKAGYQGSRSDALNVRDELSTDANQSGSARRLVGTMADQPAQAIPVVQEDLQVGKRTVQTGGIRVYSRLVDKPIEQEIRLREEHVHVDREAVNRPATDADIRSGRDQVIEVAEYAEQPVIAKQARVVEEVRVGKDATERVEKVRDSVRQGDVQVEKLGDRQQNTSQSYDDADFRAHFAGANPGGSASYQDYAPAYRYGYDAANTSSYANMEYADAEPKLRQEYATR